MKRYLKDLSAEELTKVFENNQKLREEIYSDVYEANMYMQEETGNELLSKEAMKCYDFHDHYNSFFLRLKDGYGYKLLENLNFKTLQDYSVATLEDEKLYHRLLNYYNHCNYNSDAYYDNIEKLDALAIELLSNIEELLHEYEDVTEDDALTAWLDEYFQERYADYYIDENYILFEDVQFTRCLA